MNAPTSSFPNPNPVTPPRPLLVHILYVVLLLLAFAAVSQLGAATLFWDTDAATTTATGGTGNWDTSSSLWRTDSSTGTLGTWPTTGADNDANLSGTAGTLTLTTGISVNDITVAPSPSGSYSIAGATHTLTLNGTAQSVLDVASGSSLTITSGLAGTNGFTKNSSGTLILDSAAGKDALIGSITVNGGTLQAGSATNNNASQVLRSNAVNLAGGTSLTTVGTTIDLRVGALSGSGSVTPATGGAVNVHALADATFSGAITTTGGLNLRGGNGTTQTFNGNLTGLTGTIGINNGATLKLAGTGDSTSGVIGGATVAIRGGSFVMDNSGGNTSAAAGRVSDSAAFTFLGGTVSLIGNSAGSSETVGAPTFSAGSNTISVTNNGGTGAQLTFTRAAGSWRDATGMVINFVGTGTGTLGSSGNNPRITSTGAPITVTSGTVAPLGMFANTATGATVGWATVNGTEWAGYGANGVVALTPNATPTTAANLAALTASSMAVFSPTATVTASGAVTVGALKITPNGGTTLAMGANNLTTSALMLAGTTDFSITGTGGFNGPAHKYIHVSDANTTLTMSQNMGGSNQGFTKAGLGFLSLNGTTLSFTGANNINLDSGVLRGTAAALGGATAAGGANSSINFRGGVLEISGGGTFVRAIDLPGTASGGGITFDSGGSDRGDGGFSAIGGAATVTLVTVIGGSTAASLVWNDNAFLSNGYALTMGSTKADSAITLSNNIGLDDGVTATNSYFAREIRVADNTGSSNDMAVLSGVVSGTANADLLKTGAGILQLTGANTYSGNTIISAGTLQVGSGSTTGTLGSTGAILNNGILSINRSDAFTISAPITGTGALTKLAAGTLTLSADNSYSGGTTHSAGIINISSASALGTGTFTFNGYNRLQINVADGASMTVANNIVLPSTGTGGEAELIRVGDGSPTAGTTARLTGVISGGNSSAIFSLDSDQGSNHNSTLILDNASNSFSGTLELWRGAVAFTSDGALGNANNTIKVNNAGFNGGLRFDADNITTASTRTIQLVGNEKIDTQAYTATVNGAITGTGSLRKIGSGSLTLGGTNTYSGGTTNVAGGNLRLSGGAAIPDANAVTLDNTAGVGLELLANETIGSVSGGGTTGGNINLNGNTLTLAAATATSYAGVISGTGGTLTKTGSSVFTLTGANTYTGGTNLNAGSLNITNGTELGTGALTVATPSTGTFLQVAKTAAVTVANAVVLPNPGTAQRIDLIKNAASATTGTQLNLTGAISGGGSNLSLRVTTDTAGDNTTTYRFAGNNSFTGAVELYRGAIVVANANALGTSTLQLNGNNNTTLGDLRFESSMTFANNIQLVNTANPDPISTNGNTVTLNGIISSTGTAGFVKIGAGTLVLGGTNTYTVTSTVSEGTVKVATIAANGTAQPLGQATSAIMLGGSSTTGTFEYSGATASLGRDFTVSSSTGSAGVIKNSGGGALTLAGTLTKDGKVLTLTGGAFTVSGKITGATANSDLVVDAATVTLTNATNDYNGPTIIQNSGKVIMAGDYLGIVPASTTAGNVVLNNGTLNTTSDVTLDAKRGLLIGPASGTGTGTLQADVGTTLTVNGVLANNSSGTGSLTKAGVGNVTLTAANTYTGGTSVTAGTLQLGNSGTTGDASTGDIDVATGTTLKTSRSNTLTLGQAITGAGNVDVSNTGAGTTILAKATGNTYSGTTTVNSGTLLANNTSGSATGTSTVSVNGATAVLGGTGTIGGATTVTLGQITPGTAALTGKLTFGNALTLDGTSPGTRLSLRLGASGASDFNDAANIQSHLDDNTYMTWILTQASTYEVRTGGTHDRLSVDTLNLSSGGQIVVDNTAGSSPQFGDVFNLLDWTTFNKNTFNLATDANNQRAGGLLGDLNLPGLSSGLSYDLSLFNASGASGIVIVVPEPSRALLVVLGVVSMMLRRRR